MNNHFDSDQHFLSEKLDYSMADTQYEIIMREIADFECTLDDEHEVALKLCNFGQTILMNVENIGYHNPHLIFYYGYVNGQYSQLIQHINQISFLLMSVPKSNPNAPARRIGFKSVGSSDDEQ